MAPEIDHVHITEYREFATAENALDGVELDATAHFENPTSDTTWSEQCGLAALPAPATGGEALTVESFNIGRGKLERHEFAVVWELIDYLESRGFDVDTGALARGDE